MMRFMALSGHAYKRDNGRWSFTFTAAVTAPGAVTIFEQTFRGKGDYETQVEAEAALQRSVQHFGNKVLKETKARSIDFVDQRGEIKVDLQLDTFAGAGPEVH